MVKNLDYENHEFVLKMLGKEPIVMKVWQITAKLQVT
jgi:hypothetical protein